MAFTRQPKVAPVPEFMTHHRGQFVVFGETNTGDELVPERRVFLQSDGRWAWTADFFPSKHSAEEALTTALANIAQLAAQGADLDVAAQAYESRRSNLLGDLRSLVSGDAFKDESK